MRNAKKCPKIPYSAMVNKVKKWSHANPDHHQKLITSRVSPLAHVCQVWSTFVSAFVSYPVYRMTDGILIRIFRLIRIRSVGSVPKCYGCIILSAPVILSTMVQISCLSKCPPYFLFVKLGRFAYANDWVRCLEINTQLPIHDVALQPASCWTAEACMCMDVQACLRRMPASSNLLSRNGEDK